MQYAKKPDIHFMYWVSFPSAQSSYALWSCFFSSMAVLDCQSQINYSAKPAIYFLLCLCLPGIQEWGLFDIPIGNFIYLFRYHLYVALGIQPLNDICRQLTVSVFGCPIYHLLCCADFYTKE